MLGQQRLGFGQDDAPAPFQIAEQPLPVADGQVRLLRQERPGPLQGIRIALFQIGFAQAGVQARRLAAHLLDGRFRQLVEARLAPEDMIEPAGDLPAQFQMGHLIRPDRHPAGAIGENVRRLQHRVAQEPVGGQVPILEPGLHVFVAGRPLQPADRGDHRQQQVQLGMLRHFGLHEDGRRPGVDAGRQPVHHHVEAVLLDLPGVGIAGGQGVPVGDEEVAVVFALQLHPVLDHAVVVAEVQAPGGAHAGEHPAAGIAGRHSQRPRAGWSDGGLAACG